MRNFDNVFIRGLVLNLSVGIYDHERAALQRVVVNVKLEVGSNQGKSLDSIDEVVSYEAITNQIRQIAATKHYDLLEEIAEVIVKKISEDNRIKSILLSLDKPDIIAGTETVGIEIFRHF